MGMDDDGDIAEPLDAPEEMLDEPDIDDDKSGKVRKSRV